jgi:hypothetical protein
MKKSQNHCTLMGTFAKTALINYCFVCQPRKPNFCFPFAANKQALLFSVYIQGGEVNRGLLFAGLLTSRAVSGKISEKRWAAVLTMA